MNKVELSVNIGAIMRKCIKVTGAVFIRGNRVLAAQRGAEKILGGYWEFPGGKIEPGETAKESLEREIREELQCTAIVGELLTTTDYDYPFGTVSLTTFLCELGDEEPSLTEHQDIRWVAPEDLKSLEWAPADIPAVDLLVERLG